MTKKEKINILQHFTNFKELKFNSMNVRGGK